MTKRTMTEAVIALLILVAGLSSGYMLRSYTEPTPVVKVTTQQVHVTTQTINPNTLNQYCVVQEGAYIVSPSSDGPSTNYYQRISEFVQCAPTPLPGQDRYQP